MNIFVLDPNQAISAHKLYSLDKVRCRKQIVELCQMMATLVEFSIPKKDGTNYKTNKSIRNHPATKWLESPENFSYCRDYLYELMCVCTDDKPETHGCYNAWSRFGDSKLYGGYTDIVFQWHTKKTPQICENIFTANSIYIRLKQRGLFKNN